METNQQNPYAGMKLMAKNFTQLVVQSRIAHALTQGRARYPVYRELRFAARMELEALFDAIALDTAWRAERTNTYEMLLDAEQVVVAAYGNRKADYCICAFYIWAGSIARAEEAQRLIIAKAGAARIEEPMFSLDWYFSQGYGTDYAYLEEIADDVLLDGAYPEIRGGVRAFITRYLDAPETVLVLQGPPGTGKTRLIRAILGEMSRRKGEPARALYTGDARALENDQLFVTFMTGMHDAFVVEDADLLLKPRSDGNAHLHRFLTIGDGVARSDGRKVIFSTNLPNVGDLDDALLRPGRCFAQVNARNLTGQEARALAEQLAGGDAQKQARAALAFAAGDGGRRSLAEVYGALR